MLGTGSSRGLQPIAPSRVEEPLFPVLSSIGRRDIHAHICTIWQWMSGELPDWGREKRLGGRHGRAVREEERTGDCIGYKRDLLTRAASDICSGPQGRATCNADVLL